MDITQSKKTNLYSLVKLTEKELAALHNSITDVTVQYKIQLALLDDFNDGKEPEEKLTEKSKVKEYLEGKGLSIDGSNVSKTQSESLNGSVATDSESEEVDLEDVEAI